MTPDNLVTVRLVGGPHDGLVRRLHWRVTAFCCWWRERRGAPKNVALYEIAAESPDGAEFQFAGMEEGVWATDDFTQASFNCRSEYVIPKKRVI